MGAADNISIKKDAHIQIWCTINYFKGDLKTELARQTL